MGSLKIELFGGFRVHQEEKSILFGSRTIESLFAYLVLNRDRAHSRSSLASQFWPKLEAPQARMNLRHALYKLRRLLGETYLLTDRKDVRFNPESDYWLDVQEFETLVAKSETVTLDAEKARCLQEAVTLYHGKLMEGFDDECDEWISDEQTQWDQPHLNSLLQLAECYRHMGQFSQAIESCRKALQLHPEHETAYRQMMLYQANMGAPAEALQTYQECCEALKAHLGVEPSPETRELNEQILRQKSPSPFHLPPNNLPQFSTSFIGREWEVQEVKQLITGVGATGRSPLQQRLVTLTGAGGCGKTRLALHVARELLSQYADGVWWVDLAPLMNPAMVPQLVATRLGVKEASGQSLSKTLSDFLCSKHLLLVLDNCEHLVPACVSLIEQLLAACPRLKILATSRQELGVVAGTPWKVPSLTYVDPANLPKTLATQELMQYGAVRLFVERAHSVKSTLTLTPQNAQALAQICYQLDGIPLAIELAAAHLATQSVEQIARSLSKSFPEFRLKTKASLPRHQTLRATMNWSYGLLSKKEQTLLNRLSIFAGGWTLEAAEKVCADVGANLSVRPGRADTQVSPYEVPELLTQLVHQSLVVLEPREEPRYRLLETVRQYGHEKLLGSREIDLIRRRHWDWSVSLAEQAEPELQGPNQKTWLERLEVEHDNMREALEWTQTDASDADAGLRLAAALEQFWHVRSYFTEGREWLERVLKNGKKGTDVLRAKAFYRAAGSVMRQGDYVTARSHYEESLAIFQRLSDKPNTQRTLIGLANLAGLQGDLSSACSLYREALAIARELGNQRAAAGALTGLGSALALQGDLSESRACHEEGLMIRRALGDKRNVSTALLGLGNTAELQGDYRSARSCYAEALEIDHDMRNKLGVAYLLEGLASVATAEGLTKRAAELYGQAEVLRETLGTPLAPVERVDYDRNVATVRTALGEEIFAATWAESHAMTMEQAIEYALQNNRD